MGLLPGAWEGAQSIAKAIYTAEDVFWLLEPGIRKVCARYNEYAHWGHTPIVRSEWAEIIAGWEQLALAADSARLPIQVPELHSLPKHLKREFLREFRRNCAKLSKLIRQLSAWLHEQLAVNDQISVLGI